MRNEKNNVALKVAVVLLTITTCILGYRWYSNERKINELQMQLSQELEEKRESQNQLSEVEKLTPELFDSMHDLEKLQGQLEEYISLAFSTGLSYAAVRICYLDGSITYEKFEEIESIVEDFVYDPSVEKLNQVTQVVMDCLNEHQLE